jgi:hypothetical protein
MVRIRENRQKYLISCVADAEFVCIYNMLQIMENTP